MQEELYESKQQKQQQHQYQSRRVSNAKKKTLKRNSIPFTRLFDGLGGYDISYTNSEHSLTYGEVKETSIPILYEIFNKYAPLNKISYPFRNFYDLGAGIGKVIVGMAYMNTTLHTTGIEIVPERVQTGNTAIERIKVDQIKKRIELLCISMFDDTINYSDACWIFISNLTMSDNNTEKLVLKLESELKNGCIIVTSKELNNKSFKKLNTITLPMTWSDESKVIVYIKV